MLTAQELGGIMAMMPAFTTDDAADMRARDTIDVARLRSGLDRVVRDGADVIATTGSFGECHTLLAHEFATLAHESADIVKRRVPLFIGVTAPNAREVVERMKIVSETTADGVLAGVPYYFPSSLANAVRFYREIAELFPKLNIMIYHNPTLHNVTLTLEVFEELVKLPSIIGMKDSHRDTLTFMKLQKIIAGHISVFCNQLQYVPYAELGARGLWSIDAWMGPWPLLALRDAVARKEWAAAKDITLDIAPKGTRKVDLSWRETAAKIAIRFAGYVDPGPLRPPFLEIPQAVIDAQRKKADDWKTLCAKYAPAYRR